VTASLLSHQWFRPEAKADERYKLAHTYVRAVEEANSGLRLRQYRNAISYTGEAPVGAWRVRWKNASSFRPQEQNRVGLIEAVNDTAESMIGATSVGVSFLTDGAEWSAHRRAVNLDRWLEADQERLRLRYLRTMKFRDSLWAEIGALYWDDDGQKVRCRRWDPMSVVVDERTCIGSTGPTQIHLLEIKDRDEAMAELGVDAGAKKAIEKATGQWVSYVTLSPEMLLILRSWKLPTLRRDGTLVPGRMLTYTDGGIIDDVEWTRSFPISVYRWKDPLSGFYGRSPADMLQWDQARVNKMRRFIAYCQDLMAAPKWLQKESEGDIPITNEPGGVQKWLKDKPEPITPPAVSQEIYADEERSYRRGFERIGVSQLSATLKTPSADFATGPAFQEYRDYELGRFQSQVIRFDEDLIEDAQQHIAAQKELALRVDGGSVSWRSQNLARRIKWSEVNKEGDSYVIKLKPSAAVSRTPAGQEARATRLAASGLIDRTMALRMSGIPDAQRMVDLLDAPFDAVERIIEDMLDDKFVPPPDRHFPFLLGLKLVPLAMTKAQNDGAPDIPTLEGMRRWIRMAELLEQRMKAPQGAPQFATGAAPGQPQFGPGGPPPATGAPPPPVAMGA